MKGLTLSLFSFLLLIKSVSAQFFPQDGWYSFWDFFWYGDFPYGYFETSWGFFILVTCLLTVILFAGLQRTKPFKDPDKKKIAVLTAFIIALIVTTTSPFAFWLRDLLGLSAWVLTLVLLILIFVGGWTLLRVGWEEGSTHRSKAITKASTASTEKEKAQQHAHEAKVEHQLKKDELKALSDIRKAAHRENIHDLTRGIDELQQLLRSESRIVRRAREARDNAEHDIARIVPHVRRTPAGAWLTAATPQERSAFSEMERIRNDLRALAISIDGAFAGIWTEFRNLNRFGNSQDLDKAATLVKAMRRDIRNIHGDERRVENFEDRFDRDLRRIRVLLAGRGIVI